MNDATIFGASRGVWMGLLDHVANPEVELAFLLNQVERELRAEVLSQRPDHDYDPARVHLRLHMEYLAPAREDL